TLSELLWCREGIHSDKALFCLIAALTIDSFVYGFVGVFIWQRWLKRRSSEMEFISEDDLKTFDGWLKYQAVDPVETSAEELTRWRQIFDEAKARAAMKPKVGLMKLQPVPGEYKYAVAVEDGSDLWLALWMRRSRKGEFFVMQLVGDSDWDPHTSYHLDGTF